MSKRRFLLLVALLASGATFSLFSCSQKIYREPGVRQLPAAGYLEALEADPDAYLLDIRTGFEYRRQHLDGAENISYLSGSFGRRVAELDTARTVFIYCETAHRSPLAARKLWKRGFRQIVDLKGGYRTLRTK